VTKKEQSYNLFLVRRLVHAIQKLATADADSSRWLESKSLHEFLNACALRSRDLGRRDLGYLFFDLARRLSPDNVWYAINASIELRDKGDVSASVGRLDRILAKEPENPLALHEKAVCLMLLGATHEATQILRKVVRLDPTHGFAWANLLRSSIAALNFDESVALIGDLRSRALVDGDALNMLGQLIVFLRLHHQQISGLAADKDPRIALDGYFQDLSSRVAADVIAALDARRPFSLIRLGDGEGALLASIAFNADTEFDALLKFNRSDFLSRWFGVNADHAARCIEILTRGLCEAIDGADFVGVPDHAWWARELALADSRGLPSLGAVFFYVRNFDPKRLVHHQINHALNEFGGLDAILTGRQNPIVVIGPHPELDNYVQTRFRVDDVRAIRVPARQADLPSLDYRQDQRRHFPDVYNEVCKTLEDLPAGCICLVGAGPLGKIYCATAKNHGHVAIDIGSVLDDWANLRPRHYA
jgi:tetratricopeptide (TPR) repeat protein